MKAKELKEALVNVPDDAVIILDYGEDYAIEAQVSEFDEYQNVFFIS